MARKKRTAASSGGPPAKKIKATEVNMMEDKAAENQATENQAIDAKPAEYKAPARKKHKIKQTSDLAVRRVTRSMTTDAARQAVLQTNELLGAILVNLPMKQLFVMQRVSKHFKELIATTPKLQEKMFLRCTGFPTETWTIQERVSWARGPATRTPVVLNPVLIDKIYLEASMPDWYFEMLREANRKIWVDCRGFPIKQKVSLLDTYISDPPCHVAEGLSFKVRFQAPAMNSKLSASENYLLCISPEMVESRKGLTFGDILNAGLNAELNSYSRTEVYFYGEWYNLVDVKLWDDATLNHAINRLSVKYGHASIEFERLRLDVIAPSDADWAAVRSGSLPKLPYGKVVSNKPTIRSNLADA